VRSIAVCSGSDCELTYERRIALLGLAACAPSLVTALGFLGAADIRLPFKIAIACWLLAVTAVAIEILYDRTTYPLHTLANVAASIREDDFSLRIRATGPGALDVMGRELNALSAILRERRLDDVEASALVRAIVAEIDAGIFAFGVDGRVQLVNPAGERLLDLRADQILGRTADELEAWFTERRGRWAIRRGSFREKGRRHEMLVISDVSRELRAEELLAWQRLVRVLTHELNNSLAPIKAIASSLEQTIAQCDDPEDWRDDTRRGLSVISSRAEALTRFTQAYARLARLPTPTLFPVGLHDIATRVLALTGGPVRVEHGPPVIVVADADQIEQALINLLQNAIDASVETNGNVLFTWTIRDHMVDILIMDEGLGLSGSANLFVPFFTTKPGGTGIGLVLSRQIAEAHGGVLTLRNRGDREGCEARLSLPV
jgi:two-component system nitrogen regulation sensor histidine kinase NtrY